MGKGALGTWRSKVWSTTKVGGAMILRTSCWGKPAWVGVYVSEHLSFTCLGKTSRGKPRSKPESGNPTFRDCRGARGNVTLSFVIKCARLGSIPTPGTGSLHPVAIETMAEATKL